MSACRKKADKPSSGVLGFDGVEPAATGRPVLLYPSVLLKLSQLNLEISPSQVVWPRVVLVLGLSICFAPANVAAYLYTPPLLRGAAVGLLSLLRNEGGSVGTSLAQTMQ